MIALALLALAAFLIAYARWPGLLARAAAWLALLVGIGVGGLLPGCPLRPTPPTEAVCPERPNCGLCSSEAVCVWCASDDVDRGCVAATRPGACSGSLVTVPDLCPLDATGEL